MKKSLLILSVVFSAFAQAQDCSKIFISEYVEGWSNNKALEIYNPTAVPVNLAEYFVTRYSNGSTSAQVKHSVQLSGTIAPYGVYVAVLDKQNPNGTGQEAPVWDSLQARADGFYSPDYNTSQAFYWNGDDAVALIKGTLTSDPNQVVSTIQGIQVYDIFGKIGEQPTNVTGTTSPAGGWSTEFPYTGVNGVIVSQDHSLIRKASIKVGVTSPLISFFNPLAEYDSIPPVIVRLDAMGDTVFGTTGNPILDGNWSSLGSHACDCSPLSVAKLSSSELTIYPNPSKGSFNVKGLDNISKMVVFNALGQKIETIQTSGKLATTFTLDMKGLYFVQFIQGNGEVTTKKVIVK